MSSIIEIKRLIIEVVRATTAMMFLQSLFLPFFFKAVLLSVNHCFLATSIVYFGLTEMSTVFPNFFILY